MADNNAKKELPSCVCFGLRYRMCVLEKINKIGRDWMTPKVSNDWFLAGLVFDLLHGLLDDDDEQRYDYVLFVRLGYKLIDLVSSVNFVLKKFDDKEEN